MGIFQVFLDPIGTILGAISPALGDAWTTITKWTGVYYVGEFIGKNIIEPVVKWLFGLEDKDIYEVDVVACDIFKSKLFEETQLDLITKYMKKEEWGAREYALGFADTGEKQFGKYYRYGKWYYLDYLPELRISGTTIDTKEIKSILDRIKNDDVAITDVLVTAPYDDDWCKWLLQENYNYDYNGDFLQKDGKYYKFGSSKYNVNTDKLDVTMNPIKTIRIRVYDTTVVKIIPISALDIKTYREEDRIKVNEEVSIVNTDTMLVQTLYEDIRIVKYDVEQIVITPHPSNPKLEILNRAVHHITEYYIEASMLLFDYLDELETFTPYEITAGSVQNSETTTLISNEITSHYIKYSAVTRVTTEVLVATGKSIKETGELLSSSLELVNEPVEQMEEIDIETEIAIRPFLKTTIATRIVNSDSNGNFINEEYSINSTEYTNDYEGSQEYHYRDLISHVEASANETEQTTISRETTYSSTETGIIYIRNVDIIKNESKPIPEGTGHSYTNTTLVTDYDWTTGTTTPIVISFDTHQNKRRYSVYYNSLNTGKKYIWIYDPSTNIYTQLSTPVEVIQNIEAYPITMVRNYYFDVTDYNLSSKDGRSRPSTITEDRYKKTKDLLNEIGVDVGELIKSYSKNGDISKVQDAFYLFGISPSNNKPIISKVLFEMFDFISDRLPYIQGEAGCSATYKEMPFNASFIWEPRPVTITKANIGMIGTYKHSINGSNIILQKQITLDEVKTITLGECRCFTIVNWSIANGGKDFQMNDSNLVIPLVVPVVERLSLMDRTELLGNSAYLIFYSFQHTHLEWYQTSEFANAMKIIGYAIAIIIAIVVTVFTFGNVAAGMSAMAIFMMVFQKLVIGLALTLVLQLIVANVKDTKLKILLGVAATAAAIYFGGGFSAGQSIGQTAVQIAQLCTTALDMYAQDQSQKIQKEMDKLKEEMTNFQSNYTKKSKELSDIYENMTSGLNSSNMVGLIDMSSFESSHNESADILMLSPSQFYHMSINAYRNYDIYYTGFYDSTVHKFHKNKLNMGVTQDEE